MKRRQFLSAGMVGAAGAAVAAPALAQAMPEVKWRLASAAAKSQDLPYAAAELFARSVSDATDGRFQVQVGPNPDPAGTVFDAVAAGTCEVGHEALAASSGKSAAYALVSAVPFGLNTRGANAWFAAGGGLDLTNELLGKAGLYALPGGNTGAAMGGWSKREIKSLDALRGLRIRVSGLAGPIFEKLGALPQRLAAGEIAGALERGTLDAAGSLGPVEDERLGLVKAAPFIHYPGWWEGNSALLFLFNAAKWRELPKSYQSIATAAAAGVNADLTARLDARNPAALRRLVGAGAQLRAFPQEVLEAAYKATVDTFAELSTGNAEFKKIWDSVRAFRGEEYLWFQVAEYTFDNFMIRTRARGG